MSSGYRFGVACPRCAGTVDHLTGGTFNSEPKSTYTKPYVMVATAVVRCDPCNKEWLIRAVMEPAGRG